MPEYLTPGVYVEETSFRSRSIEGVPTSTFGMAGYTRYGPISYSLPQGPTVLVTPTLVTSFTEFERAFGDLEDLYGRPSYLGHAARAFFANGGRRLYVSRVFPWLVDDDEAIQPENFAALDVGAPAVARWRARWPGAFGGEISVQVEFRRSKNVVVDGALTGVQDGSLVEVAPVANGQAQVPGDDVPPVGDNVRVVARRTDGTFGYRGAGGAIDPVPADQAAFRIRLAVTVRAGDRLDAYNELELDEAHPRSVFTVLQPEDPADEFSLVYLSRLPVPPGGQAPTAGALLRDLLGDRTPRFLTGGRDGATPATADLEGEPADQDDVTSPATGLYALGEVDDVAIVATPDTVRFDADGQKVAVDALVRHCERLRYRMAIVDPPDESSLSEVREFRSKFDTRYAALYYPWLEIIDPNLRPDPGSTAPKLLLPPSGFVAGIYARSDIERGVHKAPANEVVFGITRFERNITFDQQSVLNPEGVNALRFFEGRANRVWGARTMSSDPEWRYVNVRRLFIYLEHSIDKATQWAVFEPNNERLWGSIRQSVEDFLLVTWRSGALMGTRPQEAFFVRCDRTTMTQNDLDNGRLIVLIGVAPTYPAEFVIFRIGQWTADARSS